MEFWIGLAAGMVTGSKEVYDSFCCLLAGAIVFGTFW